MDAAQIVEAEHRRHKARYARLAGVAERMKRLLEDGVTLVDTMDAPPLELRLWAGAAVEIIRDIEEAQP